MDPVRSKRSMHAVDLNDGLLHLRRRRYDAEGQQREPKQMFPVHDAFLLYDFSENVSKAEEHPDPWLGLQAIQFLNHGYGRRKLKDQISLHEILYARRDIEQPPELSNTR